MIFSHVDPFPLLESRPILTLDIESDSTSVEEDQVEEVIA
jgi:hypothetical protein